MVLVEKHQIKKTHKYYNEIDKLAFLSKNLYNISLYNIRQYFFETKEFFNLTKNYDLIKNQQRVDYEAMPRKVSNKVVLQINQDFNSFFKGLNEYKKNPSKFKGKPEIPHYKDKIDGRNVVMYEKGAISKKQLDKGFFNPSGTDIYISTKITNKEIKEARLVKKINSYVIEIIYEKENKELIKDNGVYCGGDLGMNNLIAMTFNNGDKPLIVNGKPLKSINHFYNKRLAFLKSELETKNKLKTSKQIKKLTQKRNNKIDDYMHKASRMIVNLLVSKGITKMVIGKNKNWKQDINIGKKNNQNFVQIPFYKFINLIKYKCLLEGIDVITNEESYTSKCSFFDEETIKKHDVYLGKRIKRGLFRTAKGLLINADVNGSYNIMKKAIPNAFANGIQGLAVNPLKLNVL